MIERRTRNAKRRTKKGRGFMLAELIVALSILGILMAGLAVTLYGVGRFNRLLWCRQQCLAAAQAQVDSLATTGRTLDPDAVSALWPRLKTVTEVRSGQGPWQGLDLVKVTASVPTGSHVVRVTLARYEDLSGLTSREGR